MMIIIVVANKQLSLSCMTIKKTDIENRLTAASDRILVLIENQEFLFLLFKYIEL